MNAPLLFDWRRDEADVPAGGVSRRVSGLRNGNGVWMP